MLPSAQPNRPLILWTIGPMLPTSDQLARLTQVQQPALGLWESHFGDFCRCPVYLRRLPLILLAVPVPMERCKVRREISLPPTGTIAWPPPPSSLPGAQT